MKIKSNKIGLKAIVVLIFIATLTLSIDAQRNGIWRFTSHANAQDWVEVGEEEGEDYMDDDVGEESVAAGDLYQYIKGYTLRTVTCYKMWVKKDSQGNEIDYKVTQGSKRQCAQKASSICKLDNETNCNAAKPVF